ncbi:substrate-binding domain-containing protein [Streptomyces sp. NPDC050848]|uniref:LacI family DNA-binding transcriptional regulator n=1 Tax=Streptomyces sp. NPDC050848 TaxID=3155791 RepID=UPI0033E9AE14
MRYTVDERHERIVELVREHGSLRLADLAHHLGISAVTARRDVETLAASGRLDRVRGAVHWPGTPAPQGRPPQPIPETRGPAAPEPEAPVIGMVVPQSQHYFGEIIRGAREAVAAAGGRLILGYSGYRPDQDAAQVDRMLEAGVHGLLLTPSWPSGTGGAGDAGDTGDASGAGAAGSTEDAGGTGATTGADADFAVPAVLVERRGEVGTRVAGLDHVCTDHAGGAGLAVRHLVDLGHRKIVLIAGESPTAVQVRRGYETALRTCGVSGPPIEPIALYGGDIDTARLDAAAEQLAALVEKDGVTAALVLSDIDAILLLQSLRARAARIGVPEDLALVAYDDDVAALSDLPLTAVAPPKYEIGATAAELLLQRVRERAAGTTAGARRHVDLLPELRVRASCGAAAAQDVATDAAQAVSQDVSSPAR